MVGLVVCVMVDINDMENFFLKRKVKNHRVHSGKRMRSVVDNGESMCEVMSNINSDTNRVWVSKRW